MLWSLVIAAVLAVSAYALSGRQAGFAVVVGALIMAANFRLASGTLRKIVVPGADPTRATAVGAISFMVRYLVVGLVLFVAVRAGVQPMFLLVGVSALVLSVLGSTLTMLKGAR